MWIEIFKKESIETYYTLEILNVFFLSNLLVLIRNMFCFIVHEKESVSKFDS